MIKLIIAVMLMSAIFTNSAWGQEYVVKQGDIIHISVWGEDDLDLEVTINEGGAISYPLIGKVEIAGMTTQEVDDKITGLLKKDYFVNPDVTVAMAVLQFFVTGEVSAPGAYPILGNITPLQAITLAGGFTDFGSHTVKIIRKAGDKAKTIKVNVDSIEGKESGVDEEYIIKPNDVIVVPRSFF